MDRSELGFINAVEFRAWLRVRYPRENGWTHERIGEELGLSAGFVGMLLNGRRRPSKAALKALKMEAITFYRLKNDPFTGKPWGKINTNAPGTTMSEQDRWSDALSVVDSVSKNPSRASEHLDIRIVGPSYSITLMSLDDFRILVERARSALN